MCATAAPAAVWRPSAVHGYDLCLAATPVNCDGVVYTPIPYVPQRGELVQSEVLTALSREENNCISAVASATPAPRDDVFNMPDDWDGGADDCCQLPSLSAAEILFNLRRRFFRKPLPAIYTAAGPVLLSLNPNRPLPQLFTKDVHALYANALDLSQTPPHAYQLAENVYRRCCRHGVSSTVVVSGDSGAGKTEMSKIILQHLLAREKLSPGIDSCTSTQESMSNSLSPPSAQPLSLTCVQAIDEVLEAFGNATTCRNWNSSRFVRLSELPYKEGSAVGCEVSISLLENSRVTDRAAGDRNFHIFYFLLAGCSKQHLRALHLQADANLYSYTRFEKRKNSPSETACQSDMRRHTALMRAIALIGIEEDLLASIWRIVAAVLHLGNVYHGQKPDLQHLAFAAKLFGFPSVDNLSEVLDSRVVRDNVKKPRTLSQKVATVDSIARRVYLRLFERIIVRKAAASVRKAVADDSTLPRIGVLDIFGFENLNKNSMEQLLINSTNEKLHKCFMEHLVTSEQELYRREGVFWRDYDVSASDKVLNLIIDGGRGATRSILGLLDDASLLCSQGSSGNEDSFVASLRSLAGTLEYEAIFKSKKTLPSRGRGTPSGPYTFVIQHYAGEVQYEGEGWVSRNVDRLEPEIAATFTAHSQDATVRALFEPTESTSQRNAALGRFDSLAKKFVSDVDSLLQKLGKTQLVFAKNYVTSSEPRPDHFEGGLVLTQMRQSGLFGLIQLLRQGFPTHLTLQHHQLRCFAWVIDEAMLRCRGNTSQVTRSERLASAKDTVQLAMRLLMPAPCRNEYAVGDSLLFLRGSAAHIVAHTIRLHERTRHLSASAKLTAHTKTAKSKTLTAPSEDLQLHSTYAEAYKWLVLRKWAAYGCIVVRLLKLYKRVHLKRLIEPLMLKLAMDKFIEASNNHPLATTYSPWFYLSRQRLFQSQDGLTTIFFDGVKLWYINERTQQVARLYINEEGRLSTQRVGHDVEVIDLASSAKKSWLCVSTPKDLFCYEYGQFRKNAIAASTLTCRRHISLEKELEGSMQLVRTSFVNWRQRRGGVILVSFCVSKSRMSLLPQCRATFAGRILTARCDSTKTEGAVLVGRMDCQLPLPSLKAGTRFTRKCCYRALFPQYMFANQSVQARATLTELIRGAFVQDITNERVLLGWCGFFAVLQLSNAGSSITPLCTVHDFEAPLKLRHLWYRNAASLGNFTLLGTLGGDLVCLNLDNRTVVAIATLPPHTITVRPPKGPACLQSVENGNVIGLTHCGQLYRIQWTGEGLRVEHLRSIDLPDAKIVTADISGQRPVVADVARAALAFFSSSFCGGSATAASETPTKTDLPPRFTVCNVSYSGTAPNDAT